MLLVAGAGVNDVTAGGQLVLLATGLRECVSELTKCKADIEIHYTSNGERVIGKLDSLIPQHVKRCFPYVLLLSCPAECSERGISQGYGRQGRQ
jgi:hypothetical protein